MIFPLAHFHVLGSRRCLVRFAACLPLCLSALPECLCLPWSAPLLPCAALPLALSHAPSRPLKRHLLDWRFCISTLFVFCLLASFFTPFFSFFFSIRPLHPLFILLHLSHRHGHPFVATHSAKVASALAGRDSGKVSPLYRTPYHSRGTGEKQGPR